MVSRFGADIRLIGSTYSTFLPGSRDALGDGAVVTSVAACAGRERRGASSAVIWGACGGSSSSSSSSASSPCTARSSRGHVTRWVTVTLSPRGRPAGIVIGCHLAVSWGAWGGHRHHDHQHMNLILLLLLSIIIIARSVRGHGTRWVTVTLSPRLRPAQGVKRGDFSASVICLSGCHLGGLRGIKTILESLPSSSSSSSSSAASSSAAAAPPPPPPHDRHYDHHHHHHHRTCGVGGTPGDLCRNWVSTSRTTTRVMTFFHVGFSTCLKCEST
jgi:hypothetical protein